MGPVEKMTLLVLVRNGRANVIARPGVIEFSPNDSFNQVLGQPISQTYRILVAVQDNTEGWTTDGPVDFMANAGALVRHSPALIDASHPIQKHLIGNVVAYRVNYLPTGLAGHQAHIMAIYNNKIYEWLVEPAQLNGDERNMSYVEAILLAFELK
jgi:hypothetical protein